MNGDAEISDLSCEIPCTFEIPDAPKALYHARRAVLAVGLILVQPINIHASHIHIRLAGHNPVRHQPTNTAPGQDPDRVQASGNEIVVELGRLA